jgi:hypothetical protein
MRLAAILAISLSLGGCVTAQERAERINAADAAACQSYGAVVGSPEYIQCRTVKSQQHEIASATISAAAVGNAPKTCHSFGATTTCW